MEMICLGDSPRLEKSHFPTRPVKKVDYSGKCMAEKLLKAQQIADHFGLTRRHVELLGQRRAIPVVKLSARCHRFRLSEVESALAKLTRKTV